MSVFDYLDYRVFLNAFYRERKRLNPSYSYRVFSNTARIRSPNYLKLVIDGKRRITERSLDAFVLGVRLLGPEADYFRNLVRSEEAPDPQERARAIRRLVELRNEAARGWSESAAESSASPA
jgi:uncharacterized protein (TIGR02147 family)